MNPTGVAISALSSVDNAYTWRIRKLGECLREHSIGCDFFFMGDHRPLDVQTTAPLFMPLWLPMLRKCDFVYCGAPMAGHALFFCQRFLRGPILLDMHGDDIAQSAYANEIYSGGACRSASPRVKLVYRMAMSSADYWLTQSTWQMEDLIEAGVSADSVSVVRNGVDLDLFKFTPQPRNANFKFGYFGGFQSWQGVGDLMDAFEGVHDSSVRMLLVGFTQQDNNVKETFRSRFGPRVELVDMVDRQSIFKLFESVEILVSARPGHVASRAAFPTKFAEYASLGRPILVTDVDETAQFVRKYDCGFVSGSSPINLAQTMNEALRVPWEDLAAMGQRARTMAEDNFSWEKVGHEYAQLIREITSKFCRRRLLYH